jgi:hypothetical protein
MDSKVPIYFESAAEVRANVRQRSKDSVYPGIPPTVLPDNLKKSMFARTAWMLGLAVAPTDSTTAARSNSAMMATPGQ